MGFNKPKLESRKTGSEHPLGKPVTESPGRELKPMGLLGIFKRAYIRLNEATGGESPEAQPAIQSLPRGVVEAYATAYDRRMIR